MSGDAGQDVAKVGEGLDSMTLAGGESCRDGERVMPSLVLDKSAVRAAQKGILKSLRKRFDFILLDTLLHEIATERWDERDMLSLDDRRILESRISASLSRTCEAGDDWLSEDVAIQWEVEHGQSARLAPRHPIQLTVEDIHTALEKAGDATFADERNRGAIASLTHAPEDELQCRRIRRMCRGEFFEYLQNLLSSQQFLDELPTQARCGYEKIAHQRGLVLSPLFFPGRDWFTYGIDLVWRAYVPWKFWRVGDAVANTSKPANAFFDMLYIAAMALGDGLLSCDTDMLRIAWVCWPEKRAHILRYKQSTHTTETFQPDWD